MKNDFKRKLFLIDEDFNEGCKGYWTSTLDGDEFDCEYDTSIDCDQCKYSVGRKDPSAKCNLNR